MHTTSHLVLAAMLIPCASPMVADAQVANDDCSTALTLSEGLHTGLSNVGAAVGTGASCGPNFRDVWVRYVPSCTGTATLHTISTGTTFDTLLTLYAGPCSSLTQLACASGLSGNGELVTASVVAGSEYYLRVASQSSAQSGSFDLAIACYDSSVPPANDECAGAISIPAGVNFGLSNAGATTSMPWSCGNGGKDVWYRFDVPCTPISPFTIDTCCPAQGTNFDTMLDVYKGSCGALVPVVCNDNFSGVYAGWTIGVTQGETLYMRVGGANGAEGVFTLKINFTCPPTPPANDLCSGAIQISDGLGPIHSTVGATDDGYVSWGQGCLDVGSGGDVWFRYQATCNGWTSISTCNTATTAGVGLQVFPDICPPGPFDALACANANCGSHESVEFLATSGSQYLLLADHGIAPGNLQLSTVCAPLLANDECAGATPAQTGINPLDSTLGATKSSLAWACPLPALSCDVWRSYAAPCSGNATFSLCPPTGGTSDKVRRIAVYGGTCGALVPLGCAFGATLACPSSEVTIPVTQGQTYLVRLGGHPGALSKLEQWGDYRLLITFTGSVGSFTEIATGCGDLGLSASGSATPGANVAFQLEGSVGVPLVWIGLPMTLPLCSPEGCTQGASLVLVNPGTSFPGVIPCNLGLVGATFAAQGADLLSPGGCTSAPLGLPLRVSDTVQMVIG